MTTATITRTQDYLVIKIPLKTLAKEREIPIAVEDEEAIKEGLRDIAEGRVTPAFRNVKEFKLFLRHR